MDFGVIENMIKVMNNSKLAYLEVNWEDISIVMKKEKKSEGKTVLERYEKGYGKEDGRNVSRLEPDKVEKKNDARNVKIVTSPVVGTFYSSSNPDKPSFVSVGSKVKKGDVLCIIEAMKLMNEIQSEVDGEVSEILVKNEQMVEYGQPLFKIRTDN